MEDCCENKQRENQKKIQQLASHLGSGGESHQRVCPWREKKRTSILHWGLAKLRKFVIQQPEVRRDVSDIRDHVEQMGRTTLPTHYTH
jgi:hypothetical protein